jgi:hypothetical protein
MIMCTHQQAHSRTHRTHTRIRRTTACKKLTCTQWGLRNPTSIHRAPQPTPPCMLRSVVVLHDGYHFIGQRRSVLTINQEPGAVKGAGRRFATKHSSWLISACQPRPIPTAKITATNTARQASTAKQAQRAGHIAYAHSHTYP